jgi:hypothetical protein
MERFDAMHVFVRVVEAGSLSAATREIPMSLTSVSRHLSARIAANRRDRQNFPLRRRARQRERAAGRTILEVRISNKMLRRTPPGL